MMKHIPLFMLAAASLSLVACGTEAETGNLAGGDEAANASAADVVADPVDVNVALPNASEEALPPAAEAAEPLPRAQPDREPPPPPPAPEAEPVAEDPHAGHDMNNMSH